MKILFLTVGTSALTAPHLLDGLADARQRRLAEHIGHYQDLRDDAAGQRRYEDEEDLFPEILQVHRDRWRDWCGDSDRLTTSAEMSSTSLLLAETTLLAPWEVKDRFVLLLSDTEICNLAGRLNGQLIHDVLCGCRCGADFSRGQPKCTRVTLHRIDTMDAAQGFEPISGHIERLMKEMQDGETEFSFNITGGFKGAIPSVTWVAGRWKCPMYYLHESQSAIIRVDFLPTGELREELHATSRFVRYGSGT